MKDFALIIGAMKAGTTSLFNYLAHHSQIAPCKVKEPHFFVDDEKWSKGWSWYEGLWHWQLERHKVALEASTGYTKLPRFANAAERIASVSAHFKFIYIMRDPIERIESHYTHGQSSDWETTKAPLSNGVHPQLIAVSKYAMQLDEYYKRFPDKDIKLLLFEDLKARPHDIVKDVCEFLDVDPSYQSEQIGTVINANRYKITNPMLIKLQRSKLGSAMSSMLPSVTKDAFKRKLGRKSGNFRLTPEQRNDALTALKPDLQRLKRHYGVDVSRWGIEV